MKMLYNSIQPRVLEVNRYGSTLNCPVCGTYKDEIRKGSYNIVCWDCYDAINVVMFHRIADWMSTIKGTRIEIPDWIPIIERR